MDATGQVLNAQCQKDFVFDVQPHKVPDSIQAGTAELIYYDGQGVAYSTYYALTPGDINVTSSLPYQVDSFKRVSPVSRSVICIVVAMGTISSASRF